MSVICFGDSNTYGYDPRSFFGSRHPAEHRWVDLLGEKTGWHIRNAGLNGREIPRVMPELPEDTQLLIVMLGTNDLLQGRSVHETADRMERFLNSLTISRKCVMLIAPPPMSRGEWVPNESLIEASQVLARTYRALAERCGILFADAGAWNVPLCYDGVHFTEEGHRRFADGLFQFLQKECV